MMKLQLQELVSILIYILSWNGVYAATLRIMPIGDALTFGYKQEPGAYRTKLQSQLSLLGYTVDFVGNRISGGTQHEGHKNFNIAKMTDHVDEFLDAHDPDIILLIMGSRDVVDVDTFDAAADRYSRLIEKLSASRPLSPIFVANLPPRKNSDQNNRIQQLFNPKIPLIVQEHQSAGRLVTFVDINNVMSDSDLATNIQPTVEGYAKIGDAFTAAITNQVSPTLGGLARGILRVEGSLDRRQITVTFTKPFPMKKGTVDSFYVNKNLAILGAEFVDQERRVIQLTTSEQTPGMTYKLDVLRGIPRHRTREFTTGWRMIAIADWHLGEKYVFAQNQDQISNDIEIVKYLKENYQGEVLMIPGDTNAGFWDTSEFLSEMRSHVGIDISQEQAVLEAGDRCYSGLLSSFRFGGYSNVLVAIGDHELGDNTWETYSMKSRLQPQFRQAFASSFNHNYDGGFKYTKGIGNAASNPMWTPYSETSFAYVYKNTLVVTVDVLYQQNFYVDIGPMGTVTGRVTGAHLQWLDSVLEEGSKLPEVKHIIVQGHFPSLFPVRKTKSSGIYMDDNEKSEFWEVLRKHPVDFYFAGEAHLNTVSKDTKSDIIQVVSRGNFFSNFLTIDITDDTIDITSYEEVGLEKTMSNFDYVPSGHIQISKNDAVKSIVTSGELSLFDPDDPMIYFNFESKTALKDRPVLGLGELPGARRAPMVESVEVDGATCTESLINAGAFGQDYDAQSRNVGLTPGLYGLAGVFNLDSRAAIFGMGPHSGTHPVSYAMWFKTMSYGSRTLLSYEGFWNQNTVMNLRLRNGMPEVVYSANQKVFVKNRTLNDGIWHHIAVTMPFDGCSLSDMKMYIDGEEESMTLIGYDAKIDLPSGGMMSVGSFGYGSIGADNPATRSGFNAGLNFEGSLDDVMVFARTLSDSETKELATVPKPFALRSKVSYVMQEAMCLGFDLFGNGVILRSCTDGDGQQWIQDALGYIHNKLKYHKCLVPEKDANGLSRVKAEDCNSKVDNSFSWTIDLDTFLHDDTDQILVVDSSMNNAVGLSSETPDGNILPEQGWDVIYKGGFASSHLTGTPSVSPTVVPTMVPSSSPTSNPSAAPTSNPTAEPSALPSASPTSIPTSLPTSSPSTLPSDEPSNDPSGIPSFSPSSVPTVFPTDAPSRQPSVSPTHAPTMSSRPTAYICEDREGIINVGFNKFRSCEDARSNKRQCKFEPLRIHCPAACDLCISTLAPSSSPTPVPTPAPVPTPTVPLSSGGCNDSKESFTLVSGRKKTCFNAANNPNLCNKNTVQRNCPMTCNICDPPATDPPTGSPVRPVSSTCGDSTEDLVMTGTGYIRTCSEAINNPKLCAKDIFREECPASCFFCSQQSDDSGSCEDNIGRTTLPNGLQKNCWQAKNNNSLCTRYNEVREHCPVACGICDPGPCVDTMGTIVLPNGNPKFCWQARNDGGKLCRRYSEIRTGCPLSCGECF